MHLDDNNQQREDEEAKDYNPEVAQFMKGIKFA